MHKRQVLEVSHVLAMAIQFVLGNMRVLLVASVAPLILLTSLKYLESQWFQEIQHALDSPMDVQAARTPVFFVLWPWLYMVGYIAIFSVIAVAWHRITILGTASLPNRWGMHIGKREMRFLGGVAYLAWP